MRLRLFLFLIFVLQQPAVAGDSFGAHDLVVQYAGNIGQVAVGLRYFATENSYADLFLGYVPEYAADQILTPISAKWGFQYQHWSLKNRYRLRPYNGILLSYTPGDQFAIFDKPYAWNYYDSVLAFVQPYVGAELTRAGTGNTSPALYVELGILGIYIANWIHEPGDQPLDEMFNLALGLRWPL